MFMQALLRSTSTISVRVDALLPKARTPSGSHYLHLQQRLWSRRPTESPICTRRRLCASMATNVSPAEAHDIITNKGGKYVDVRTTGECEQGKVPGSINVPFLKPALLAGMAPNEAFLKELDDAGVTKSDVIVLACASGKRAAMAAQKLGEEGFTDVFVMPASYQGWKDAGLPTEE